ncbi:AlbA family DNA-binding domain-containing protein [Micromonospora sp. NPDC003944]
MEWKSTLDLTTTAGLAHIVKHIIGLANRQPAAAAQRAGGFGYLLVGVEPGAIKGVATVDLETLIGRVRPHVGDVVQWTPEHVTVDGRQVLVVIVDPPKAGDPIHCLRKQIDKFQPATVFVRHAGRTDPANPGDLDLLQARLLERTQRLQMTVAATPSTIEESPDIHDAVNQWVEQRRPVLLAARHQSARQPSVGMVGVHTGFLGPVRDTRTEEQYAEEVEEFLDGAQEVLQGRGFWDLFRHKPASLTLTVTNPTDVGYTAIRLVVDVPGQVNGYPEELVEALDGDRPGAPRPPKPLGTPFVRNLVPHLSAYNFAAHIPAPVYPGPGPSYTVRDSGSVTIEYDDFELRAEESVNLEPVPLFVLEEPDATLTATWSATAAEVRGRLTGEFTITVDPSTLDLENLDDDHEVEE